MTIQRAMLLAAGFGKRLQPLTNNVPKPLIPLDGKRLIDFALEYLAKGGVKEVMINLHHLGDHIETYVGDGYRYRLRISYSHEKVILGTGGGIKRAAPFFNHEPFICLNADTLINYDLKKLLAHHMTQKADATMVIRPLQPHDPFQAVTLNEQGTVTGFQSKGDYFYTGLQVIGPKLVELLPAAGQPSCLINDGYIPLLRSNGKVDTNKPKKILLRKKLSRTSFKPTKDKSPLFIVKETDED